MTNSESIYASVTEAMSLCSLLGASHSRPHPPEILANGIAQKGLFLTTCNACTENVREFFSYVFEPISTHTILLGNRIRHPSDEISIADTALIQLRIAEHNFSLATGLPLEDAPPYDITELMNRLLSNEEALHRALQEAGSYKTLDEVNEANVFYNQQLLPISLEETTLAIHFHVIPPLEQALFEFRQAHPEASKAYTETAREKYHRMIAARPAFIEKFKNTGSAYFDEMANDRLIECIAATAYNCSADFSQCSYEQRPLKIAEWREAKAKDASLLSVGKNQTPSVP